jgi:hypothetical protein
VPGGAAFLLPASADRQASNKNAKLADEAMQGNAMESKLLDNTTKVVKR